MNLASYLDSTNLRPEAAEKDIRALCREAALYNLAAVCVLPYRVGLAARLLEGSPVKTCTVIGFPLGADGLATKLYAATQALGEGADEIDMVINIGALKDRDLSTVIWEIDSITSLKDRYSFVLKVIVETALLNPQELAEITVLLGECGVDYIKTSTGMSARGVSLKDIEIINQHRPKHLKIKASGGIRELDFALQLLEAGVERLGTSSAAKLMEDYQIRGGR